MGSPPVEIEYYHYCFKVLLSFFSGFIPVSCFSVVSVTSIQSAMAGTANVFNLAGLRGMCGGGQAVPMRGYRQEASPLNPMIRGFWLDNKWLFYALKML